MITTAEEYEKGSTSECRYTRFVLAGDRYN